MFNRKLQLFFLKNNIFIFKKFPINKITLTLVFMSEPSFKDFSLAFAALKLISGQTPYVVCVKKPYIKKNNRKGYPIGVKVTFRRENLKFFLFRLIWEIWPKIRGLKLEQRFLKYPRTSFSFSLQDIFLFSELKNFYFFFNSLPYLKVVLSLDNFFSQEKKYNTFAKKLSCLPF